MGEEKERVYKKSVCQIRECHAGARAVMGAGVTLGAGEVVGAGLTVETGEVVGAGVAVGAGEVVGAGVTVGAGDVVGVRAMCKTAERRRPPLCLSPSRVLIA